VAATVFSWGRQREGQCGRDEKHEQSWPQKVDTGTLLFKQLDAAGNRTVAISGDNQLYSWGTGHLGELGLAYQESAIGPTPLKLVPEDLRWKQVACGYNFTIATTEEGDLYSWGANESGQLGLGHTKIIDRPTKVTSLVKITKIRAGHNHVIALNTFGEIFTWGSNQCGQLGRKIVENFAIPGKITTNDISFRYIDCNDYACAAITNKGELYTWGSGGHGRLGHGNIRNCDEPEAVKEVKDIPFLQVSLGSNHTLALTETKLIYAWGAAHHGELGYGGRRRQLKPVALNLKEKMISVLARDEISFSISASGALYSWGNSAGGLLGNGRKVGHVLVPTKIATAIEFKLISGGKKHIVGIGAGQAQPPYESWKEDDEMVDPAATKEYTDLDPEEYLYPLYFPQPKQDREKKKTTTEEDGAHPGQEEVVKGDE